MFCFFPSSFFVVKTDFWIAFTMSYTSHSKIHTYFCTFTFVVCTKIHDDVFAHTLCHTYNMFRSPNSFFFFLFYEFVRSYFTNWTYFWCSGGMCSWIVLYWLNRPYSLGWEQIRFPP